MLKQSSLGETAKSCVKKNIHILFSHFKALNNQQRERRLLLSGDLQEFSRLRERKESKKQQQEERNKRPRRNAAQNER